MNWDFSKPTPEDLLDETPFCCPYCKHTMCVIDEDFPDNVELTVFIDQESADDQLYTAA